MKHLVKRTSCLTKVGVKFSTEEREVLRSLASDLYHYATSKLSEAEQNDTHTVVVSTGALEEARRLSSIVMRITEVTHVSDPAKVLDNMIAEQPEDEIIG